MAGEKEVDPMKPFAAGATLIFALVAIVHAIRLWFGWTVVIDGLDIPMWVSWVALLIAGGLAIGLWREA
jgi:hypothetical protein